VIAGGLLANVKDGTKLHHWFLAVVCLIAVSIMVSCDVAGTQSPTISTTGTLSPTSLTTSTPGTTPISTTDTPGKVSLQKLVETAGYILVGQVANITADQPIDGKIYTLVTFSVTQKIRGETGDEVTIRVPGGEIGGIGMISTDNPTFSPGEKAVVFLSSTEGYFTVAGGMYGKVTVDENNMAGGMPLAAYIDQVKEIIAQH
jgi:hypothetical protein